MHWRPIMWGRHEHWPDTGEQLEGTTAGQPCSPLTKEPRGTIVHLVLNIKWREIFRGVFVFPSENKYMEKILPINESQTPRLKALHDLVTHWHVPCPLFTMLQPHPGGVFWRYYKCFLALTACHFCFISNCSSFPGPQTQEDSSSFAVSEANN